ncbi:hypothetical protein [Breoghania sp. JC706]|uniref:hypothetical protein n=1 Tax=Breoghania sp. JC706 TaxID=3117732 RepID=UPI00300A81D6
MDRARLAPALDAILDRALLDLLSDRIVAALKARARSALVLFSETDLGLEPAVRALASLVGAGWSLEIRRSPGACDVVSSDSLASMGGSALVPFLHPMENENRTVDAILARHAVVVVPTLSLPLAARVALGLADDEISALLAGALERGQRVVAARDGCCPAARDRNARGLTGTAAYREMMANHLGRLESYGVEFSWAAKLEGAVEAQASGMPAPHPVQALAHQIIVPAQNAIAAAPTTARGHVFGWSAAKAVAGTELCLGRDVLVTPLAAEELNARQIRLVRQ